MENFYLFQKSQSQIAEELSKLKLQIDECNTLPRRLEQRVDILEVQNGKLKRMLAGRKLKYGDEWCDARSKSAPLLQVVPFYFIIPFPLSYLIIIYSLPANLPVSQSPLDHQLPFHPIYDNYPNLQQPQIGPHPTTGFYSTTASSSPVNVSLLPIYSFPLISLFGSALIISIWQDVERTGLSSILCSLLFTSKSRYDLLYFHY